MRIGIPTESKVREGRVGLIPDAVGALVALGHPVYIEAGAGVLSGFSDSDYSQLGGILVPDAAALYGQAELIVKVKEPTQQDLSLLKQHHTLFCYLHLAAAPQLSQVLQQIGLTAVAFETVESQGKLPLLAPMSDIAGRLAVQIGAHLLHAPAGGKGILLGGLAGCQRGKVVILGGGVAGYNAAKIAVGLGAEVVVFERKRDRQEMLLTLGENITTLYPFPALLAQQVVAADLLIGAVLLTGQKAPRLVSHAWVKKMEPGSVIVDIAIDQGGCIETIRPTDYLNPTYLVDGVIHFGVTNMPGAVPKTASLALSAALLPYVEKMAHSDWEKDPELKGAINIKQGKIVHAALL